MHGSITKIRGIISTPSPYSRLQTDCTNVYHMVLVGPIHAVRMIARVELKTWSNTHCIASSFQTIDWKFRQMAALAPPNRHQQRYVQSLSVGLIFTAVQWEAIGKWFIKQQLFIYVKFVNVQTFKINAKTHMITPHSTFLRSLRQLY